MYRFEQHAHNGSGPVWTAGIGLLAAFGVAVGLSILMCNILCLYQSSTGASRMSNQRVGSTVYPSLRAQFKIVCLLFLLCICSLSSMMLI